jgi:SAM-dependent methyltransferase
MESSSNKPGGISVRRINEMSLAYQQAGVLWAGIELELFTRISEGASGPREIANALGAKLEATERLLAACVALGLVEKKNGGYSNAPDVERYLVKGKPTYHGDWALFHKGEYEQWKNLAPVLRPPKDFYQRVREDPKVARQLTVAGYHSSISAGQKFARECDLSAVSLLLDLGGGSGVYSIMACHKYANLRSIVFDVATVCAVSDEFIAQAGLSGRIRTHPCDYLADQYPSGADAILICGTLEPRSTEEHEIVLRKAFDALPPGGKLFLIINMLDDDGKGPLEAVLSNLAHVFTSGPWGRIHSAGEIARMLSAAGFVDPAFSDFVPGTYRRVIASKPR